MKNYVDGRGVTKTDDHIILHDDNSWVHISKHGNHTHGEDLSHLDTHLEGYHGTNARKEAEKKNTANWEKYKKDHGIKEATNLRKIADRILEEGYKAAPTSAMEKLGYKVKSQNDDEVEYHHPKKGHRATFDFNTGNWYHYANPNGPGGTTKGKGIKHLIATAKDNVSEEVNPLIQATTKILA